MKTTILRPFIVTIGLLLIPAVAMRFTAEVNWTPLDFVAAGVMLFVTGVGGELAWKKGSAAARASGAEGLGLWAYRAGAALGLFAALFLVWANLAVGLLGDEGNPANLMYLGVLAVGLTLAYFARWQPAGLARALCAAAAAQAVVTVVAIAMRLAQSDPLELIVGVNGFFICLYLVAAMLFKWSARPQAGATAVMA